MVVFDDAKEHWDNNDGNDYRLLVEGGEGNATNEDWDARIQERIVYLAKMREERRRRRAWRQGAPKAPGGGAPRGNAS